jgi:hypothetical protein
LIARLASEAFFEAILVVILYGQLRNAECFYSW